MTILPFRLGAAGDIRRGPPLARGRGAHDVGAAPEFDELVPGPPPAPVPVPVPVAAPLPPAPASLPPLPPPPPPFGGEDRPPWPKARTVPVP
mmetsp:Transcript_168941/g.543126  ORF Transcript_168941/g.543126 Transcript_168941/m.543126 type:complete len:92 (+) Transcript_168941:6-281(+)